MIKNWEQFNENYQNIDDLNISNYDFSEVEDAIESDDYEYGIELLKKMKNKYPNIKKDETYLELAKRLVHHVSVQENKQDKIDMLDFVDDDRNDDEDDVQLTTYDNNEDEEEDLDDIKNDDEDLEDDEDMIDLDTHNRIEYDKKSSVELTLDDAEQAIIDEDKDKVVKILRKLKSSNPDITKDKTYLNLLKKLYLL